MPRWVELASKVSSAPVDDMRAAPFIYRRGRGGAQGSTRERGEASIGYS
jgi:hypothetical protein